MFLLRRLQGTNLFGNSKNICVTLKSSYFALRNVQNIKTVKKGFRSFFNFFKKPSVERLREKDDVGESFVLIYRNQMYRTLFSAQVIAYLGGITILSGIVIKNLKEDQKNTELLWSREAVSTDAKLPQSGEAVSTDTKLPWWSLEASPTDIPLPWWNNRAEPIDTQLPWSRETVSSENEEIVYMTFLVLFVVITQLAVSRTPLRVYKMAETKSYISVSYGAFFNFSKYNFKQGQITPLPPNSILPWRDSRYMIDRTTDKRIVFLHQAYFRRPADLSIMLGLQRDPALEEEYR